MKDQNSQHLEELSALLSIQHKLALCKLTVINHVPSENQLFIKGVAADFIYLDGGYDRDIDDPINLGYNQQTTLESRDDSKCVKQIAVGIRVQQVGHEPTTIVGSRFAPEGQCFINSNIELIIRQTVSEDEIKNQDSALIEIKFA